MGALTRASSTSRSRRDAEVAVWREGFRELALRRVGELGAGRGSTSSTTAAWGGSGSAIRRRDRAGTGLPRDQRLELAGVWTHFATADELDDGFFEEQLAVFRPVAEAVKESAGLHRPRGQQRRDASRPGAHFDMVRCGIAIYGLDPFQAGSRASRDWSRRWSCTPTSRT